jgi:RNA polymerase sigma factor (sigma-70 family)
VTEKDYNEGVEAWSDDIYRFAVHCCGDTSLGQDAVQEAYTSLWQSRDKVSKEKGKSYLYRVAYHQLMSHFRHRQVTQKAEEDIVAVSSTSSEPNETFDLREAMSRAMAQLPEVQRALLQLRDIEGYPFEEIGEMMNLSTQQVHVYLFRARITMKKLLTAQGYGNK